MATHITSHARTTGSFCRRLLAIAALGACGLAQAGVLDFEQPVTQANQLAGTAVQFGNYLIQPDGIGAQPGDLVGGLFRGVDPDYCSSGLQCPVNNASTYYAGLNDGAFYLSMADGSQFSLKSFMASFIGNGQDLSNGSVLYLGGIDASFASAYDLYAFMSGPIGGKLYFDNYVLPQPFSDILISYLLVLSYPCDNVGTCRYDTTVGNFAIDDIVTGEPAIAALPEPAPLALLGLGLLGMLAALRRRAA